MSGSGRRALKRNILATGFMFDGLEGTSKRRVQDVVDLALLAPEVVDAITSGEQRDGLTTDYLIKTGFPAVWSGQYEQFAAL